MEEKLQDYNSKAKRFTDKERVEWEQAAIRCGLPRQGMHLETRETRRPVEKVEEKPDLSVLTEREKELWDKMQHGGWWRMHSMPGHREVFHELKAKIGGGKDDRTEIGEPAECS